MCSGRKSQLHNLRQLPHLMISSLGNELHALHALLCLVGYCSCKTLSYLLPMVCMSECHLMCLQHRALSAALLFTRTCCREERIAPAGFLRLARERCLASSSLATLLPTCKHTGFNTYTVKDRNIIQRNTTSYSQDCSLNGILQRFGTSLLDVRLHVPHQTLSHGLTRTKRSCFQ